MSITDRASAWKSLIADLEVECKEAEEESAKSNSRSRTSGRAPPFSVPIPTNTNPLSPGGNHVANDFSMGSMNGRAASQSFSFSSQRRSMGMGAMTGSAGSRGGGRYGMVFNSRRVRPAPSSPPAAKEPPPPPVVMPVVLPPTLPLRNWVAHFAKNRVAKPNSNTYLSWRGADQNNSKVDKKYLEDSAKIALSLAGKVHKQLSSRQLVHQRDIVLDNIVVLNTKEGDSDFIKMSNNECSLIDQRVLICALGRIYYELFTQGSSPPRPRSLERSTHNGSTTTSNSFELALRISGGRLDMEVDEDHEELNPRPLRRRREDQGKETSVSEMLYREGMPISICRLVADMLENDDYKERLFVHDNAISNFEDLLSDLKQMVDNPKLFLHDSLHMRWKPVIADKLYCRDREIMDALAVADRVSQLGNAVEVEELVDSRSLYSPKSHEVLMVSGHSGSGKTSLVKELSTILEKKGWQYLHCKFNHVHTQPLSFIISAFDGYFAKLDTSKESEPNERVHLEINELEQTRARICKALGVENLNILCQLIPSMRNLMSQEYSASEDHGYEKSFDSIDAVASKCRLHHLFGLLVRALSQKPVILFMDDLHWADQASLELIVALIAGTGEEINEGASIDSQRSHGILFLGSYRTNEIDDKHPLGISLEQMKQLSNVNFTEIQLNGLTSVEVNVMVSEALSYPKRLSRSLADLIHQKSTGNPLYVKEFLNDLAVDNLLNYSLLSRKWEWDDDKIQARTISNGVAELLTRRLLRLPKSVLSALIVISMFGSSVSMQVLSHVRDVCGNSDIIAELDVAIREGLIEKTADTCRFVHDMIEQAVHSGIAIDERTRMLQEISKTLIAKTEEGRSDAILFIAVDLINRIGPKGSSAGDHLRYANLNLLAGEKAILIPDFGSACKYIESGIVFLGQDYWSNSYNLSLHLFKNAALVQYAQGKTDLFTQRLNEVLDNARSFDDKLDSLILLIHSLTMDAEGVEKAFERSFWVLEQLGESFPPTPDNNTIAMELVTAKNQLEQYLPSTVSNIQKMDNPQKIRAMEIYPALLMQCYQQKSRFFPLVASRMATITLQYGLHQNSALGFCGLALAYATVFQDMSEGYKLGKYALAITTNRNMPDVYCTMHGMISIWKEPIQAVIPELLKAYKTGMKYGKISEALINSMLYTGRSLLSGANLSSLGKEVTTFGRQYSLYNRQLLCLSLIPFCNVMLRLTGRSYHPDNVNTDRMGEEDLMLAKALEKKEIVICETIIVRKMMCSFIFRDLNKAETVARQYLDFLEQHDSGGTVLFMTIYRYFYGGLIAFECFRRTRDQFWMDMGDRSLSKFEVWSNECEWNFKNKLLLLQAEQNFSTGNMNAAQTSYTSAISSAKDHRFIHEEALSCELASIFHSKTGRHEQSLQLLNRAKQCYKSWGAKEKVKALSSLLN